MYGTTVTANVSFCVLRLAKTDIALSVAFYVVVTIGIAYVAYTGVTAILVGTTTILRILILVHFLNLLTFISLVFPNVKFLYPYQSYSESRLAV